jgi:hypothetical protein
LLELFQKLIVGRRKTAVLEQNFNIKQGLTKIGECSLKTRGVKSKEEK